MEELLRPAPLIDQGKVSSRTREAPERGTVSMLLPDSQKRQHLFRYVRASHQPSEVLDDAPQAAALLQALQVTAQLLLHVVSAASVLAAPL